MAEGYDNTNRGVLFVNDRKRDDNDSDYNGSINIQGIEHWLNAWKKKSKDGKAFLSLSIGKPKESRGAGSSGGRDSGSSRGGGRQQERDDDGFPS